MKRTLLIFLVLLSAFSILAENIRGNTVKLINLSSISDISEEYSITIEQFLGFIPGDKSDFLEGFEILIKVPESIRDYGDSFILMLYGNLSPSPEEGKIRNYQGIEMGHRILSSRARQYIDLAMKGEDGGDSDLPLLSADDFPVMLMINPMSKGIPGALESNPFVIKVMPRWKNLGALLLESPLESLEGLELWLDDEKVAYNGQNILLPSGIHSLTARIDGYYELNQNFVIKQAETSRIELPFQAQTSTVKFAAPEGAVIYFDGEKVEFPLESPLETEKGEHSVLFKLGDYQISKQFTIISGKDYEISLFLDILVVEN